jgi:hypothetical protein
MEAGANANKHSFNDIIIYIKTNEIMMKINLLIIVSVLLSCISCHLDSNINTKDAETEANATDCVISGTLFYNSESDRWEIREVMPNSIDALTIYIIDKYDIELDKETTKTVQATGRCYDSEQKIGVPAGTTIYYIEIKTLH